MSDPEAIRWDVADEFGNIVANGDAQDFGGYDEANDWRIHHGYIGGHIVEVFATQEESPR